MKTFILAAFLGVDSGTQVMQLVVNGIITGSSYAILGIGFALILGVTRRFHFAYALTYMLAAVIAAVVAEKLELPFAAVAAVGLAAAIVVGVLIEETVYRPLAERSGDVALLPVFVASLGVTIVGENVVRLIWGSESRILFGLSREPVSVGDVTFLTLDIWTVVTAAVLVAAVALLLNYTALGREMKAVRVNPEMSLAVGINARNVYRAAFVIGSVLAGVAAIFAALKFAAAPDMGIRPVFVALVVAFLAGVSASPLAVAFTGLGVGLVESLSALWLSAKWSSLVIFALLFIYLSYYSLRLALAHQSPAALRILRARRAPGTASR